MSESTKHFAQTVHRLLKFDPSQGGFSMNEQNPLVCDYLIMDESSMLDTRLASALVRALPSNAHLLLVGDADQLPSVGSGNVLKDLIECNILPVTRLEVTFRQADDSGIVGLAHSILSGKASPPPPLEPHSALPRNHDVHFIRAETQRNALGWCAIYTKGYYPTHLGLIRKMIYRYWPHSIVGLEASGI